MNALLFIGDRGAPGDGDRLIRSAERLTQETGTLHRYSELRQHLRAMGLFANRTKNTDERRRVENWLLASCLPDTWAPRVRVWETLPGLGGLSIPLASVSILSLAQSTSPEAHEALQGLAATYGHSRTLGGVTQSALRLHERVRELGIDGLRESPRGEGPGVP